MVNSLLACPGVRFIDNDRSLVIAVRQQAALHGLGLALLPDYLVEQELANGRLQAVWGGPVESRGAYHLVWPIEASNDPALIKFKNWLAGQAETEEDPLPR